MSEVRTIVVSGSRHWPRAHRDEIDQRLFDCIRGQDFRSRGSIVLLHGAARGVDTYAHRWGKIVGVDVRPIPADWKTLGTSAGMIRNTRMLQLAIERAELGEIRLLCFPMGPSTGTRGMIYSARKRGIEPWLIHEFGNHRLEVVTEAGKRIPRCICQACVRDREPPARLGI